MANGTATVTSGKADQTDAVLVDASGHDQTFEVGSIAGRMGSTSRFGTTQADPSAWSATVGPSNFVLGLSVRQTNLTLAAHRGSVAQLEHFKKNRLFHASTPANKKKELKADHHFELPAPVEDLPSWQILQTRPRLWKTGTFLPAFQLRELSCQRGGGGNSKITLNINRSLNKTGLVDVAPSHDSFGITDAKLIKPADPAASILLQRMHRRGPGQMPPLATSLVDEEAVQMITPVDQRIAQQCSSCRPDTEPPKR